MASIQTELGILEPGNTAKGQVALTITLLFSDVDVVSGLERALPQAAGAASVRSCEKLGALVMSASAKWSPVVPLTAQVTSQKR